MLDLNLSSDDSVCDAQQIVVNPPRLLGDSAALLHQRNMTMVPEHVLIVSLNSGNVWT